MIQPTLLLGLPAHLRMDRIEITHQTLIMSLAVETVEAACPLCQHLSHRVHSHYTRTLADLPCAAKALRLLVLVRRFFCENKACARKIFAERLPELTSVYARCTTRCKERLTELGFALGGKAAAALSPQLGLQSSRMTILRMVRQTPDAAVPTMSLPCAAGKTMAPSSSIWRMARRWICFLIVKQPPWKRGSNNTQEFSSSVATALENLLVEPKKALQKRGLRLTASTCFATWQKWSRRCAGSHRQALKTIHLVTKPTTSPSPLLRHPRPDRERRKQQARAKLVERYEAVQRLVKQGLSHRAIARQLHMHRESVIRYARAETFPEQAGMTLPHFGGRKKV